jgi:hypothetical protein
MVRILRVKPWGTQFGGTGTIGSAPGVQANIRSGDNNIEQAAALLRNRVKGRRSYASKPIGSQGDL